MIHKQRLGHSMEDICYVLRSMANYLNNVAKERIGSVVFSKGEWPPTKECGALQDFIGCPVGVPEHFDVMGAIGATILARSGLNTGAITSLWGRAY